MAIGDIVSDVGALNTILDFRPAAGVDVVITSVYYAITAGGRVRLFDGTLEAFQLEATNLPVTPHQAMKMFLTNTFWLRIPASGASNSNGFTGMEVG